MQRFLCLLLCATCVGGVSGMQEDDSIAEMEPVPTEELFGAVADGNSARFDDLLSPLTKTSKARLAFVKGGSCYRCLLKDAICNDIECAKILIQETPKENRYDLLMEVEWIGTAFYAYNRDYSKDSGCYATEVIGFMDVVIKFILDMELKVFIREYMKRHNPISCLCYHYNDGVVEVAKYLLSFAEDSQEMLSWIFHENKETLLFCAMNNGNRPLFDFIFDLIKKHKETHPKIKEDYERMVSFIPCSFATSLSGSICYEFDKEEEELLKELLKTKSLARSEKQEGFVKYFTDVEEITRTRIKQKKITKEGYFPGLHCHFFLGLRRSEMAEELRKFLYEDQIDC